MKTYTAIRGNIDAPRNDIFCYTDYSKFKREVMNAKIYKILPHLFFDTDISLWIDGNITLNVEPSIVAELLGDADIAMFKHFERDCVYQEALAAAGKYPDERYHEIINHGEAYRKKGYPEHNGLWECNMIIRRHSKKMEDFSNAWWAEICRHSNRDQISLPYILEKYPLKVKTLEGNVRNHKYFNYTPH